MRRLVLGLNGDGQSVVVGEEAISFSEVLPDVGWALVFETNETPPPPRPEGHGDLLPMGVEPGLVRWNVLEWGPGVELSKHHTDTVDFDMVLSGSVELIMDDGIHQLEPGDCVVVTGVDHAWRAGPQGCRVSSVFIGTTPPPGG